MIKTTIRLIKNSCVFAFAIGFYEGLRYGDEAGRTHQTNDDWNEWYDMGMNLAEAILPNKGN